MMQESTKHPKSVNLTYIHLFLEDWQAETKYLQQQLSNSADQYVVQHQLGVKLEDNRLDPKSMFLD